MDGPRSESLKAWFESYVDSFRGNAATLQPLACGNPRRVFREPLLQIKYDHCHRVSTEALGIATELNWGEAETLMAGVVGLFHDVGRFSQFTEFNTFRDSDSVDHGNRSVEDLCRLGILDGCSGEDRQIILDSIKNHNKMSISDDLSGESLKFAKLVRDADKLDIFYVLSDAIKTRKIREFPEIVLNLPEQGSPSEKILKDLEARRLSSYTHAKSVVDLALIQLSWLYELNYKPTYRRIHDRNVINDILESVPDSVHVQKSSEILRKFLVEKCGEPM